MTLGGRDRWKAGRPTELKLKQEPVMKPAFLIILLATVILSSFAGATEDGGKAWWPQFRGPHSSGLGEGRPR